MKVAYLTNIYPSPSHAFIRREILAMEEAGHEVSRFSIRRSRETLVDSRDQDEERRTRYVLDCGIIRLLMLTALTFVRHPIRFARALRAAWRMAGAADRSVARHCVYLAEACTLAHFLSRSGVNHLHVHFGTNPSAVALLCRLLGGPPYSITIHGPDEFDSPLPLSLKEKVKHAAFVVAISQFAVSQLHRWIEPACRRKLHIIHCGLDKEYFQIEPAPLTSAPRLTFIGRLTTTKGVCILFEALHMLHSRGISFQLDIIGDGPERPEMQKILADKDYRQSIRLLGWQSQDQIRRSLQQCRALVLPSFAEGLPVVLMEALAMGRPVITTWVAGIPELVAHGENGWLVPPGSAEKLADAMEQCLSSEPALLEQMGRRGREKVLLHHNIKTEAAKLATLFERAHTA